MRLSGWLGDTQTVEEIRQPKKTIEERMTDFELELQLYKGQYPPKMLEAFYDYWSEPNISKTKMKKELNKTWDTKRRLKTWSNNDYGNNNTPLPKAEPKLSSDLQMQRDFLLKKRDNI